MYDVKSEPRSDIQILPNANFDMAFNGLGVGLGVNGLGGLARFDGRGPVSRFLDDFNRYSRLMTWDDAKKLDVLPLCLVGLARDAYDALTDEQKATFATIESGLKQSFHTRTSVDYHAALRDLKYDGSQGLDAFVIELRKLVSRAYSGPASDGLLLNSFLSTLPDDLYSSVVGAGVGTFDAAVTKVRNLQSASRHRSRPVRQVAAADAASRDAEVARLERRIAELEARLPAEAGASRPPRGPQGGLRECFACGQTSHLRYRCEHRNAICTRCDRRGHLAQVCGRFPGNSQGSSRGAMGGPAPAQEL